MTADGKLLMNITVSPMPKCALYDTTRSTPRLTITLLENSQFCGIKLISSAHPGTATRGCGCQLQERVRPPSPPAPSKRASSDRKV
jgi:hypothetical protein